jgi:hypothetical protein
MANKVIICSDKSLASSYTSDWIPLGESGSAAANSSLQISWTGADATDGTIAIELSNDGTIPTVLRTITISSASNTTDADMTIITASVLYLRIKYSKGSNTAGTFTATLFYNHGAS